MNKTDKRILHQKLTRMQEILDKRFQFFLDNQNYYKTTRVKNHNVKRYNRLSKAIAAILEDIDYKPEKKPEKSASKQGSLFKN